MRPTFFWGLVAGCSGAGQDIETPTATGEEDAPDITGSYDAVFEQAAGCEDAPPPDFVTGELVVTGPASGLSFLFENGRFEDGSELVGQVDDTFSVELEGQVTAGEFALSVTGEGLAYIDAELWVLEVDLTMDASTNGSETCTRTGVMKATQIEVAR